MNIRGIGASSGVALAEVFILKYPEFNITNDLVEDVLQEVLKFEDALEKSLKDIARIQQLTLEKLGPEKAMVFEAHTLVLQDPEFITPIKNKITNEKSNAANALNETAKFFISIFENMDNEYMKERAADIKDVSNRVLSYLLNLKLPDLALINKEVIIVAEDLTPSETSQLNKDFVKGFVTNIGGRTSHSAIMARSLEIPAVLGTNNILTTVKDGDVLFLDGDLGEVILNPNEEQIQNFNKTLEAQKNAKELLLRLKDAKTISNDNHHVEIAANIGSPNDLTGVLANGSEGIGLYRTEFLYMDSKEFPTEEEQFNAYKIVLEKMENKAVVIRTLDIGGDKELPYLKLPHEMNPFLGYRAIRICLDRKDIFNTQIRALLRASVYGNLKIMFPMIATVKEFLDAKEFTLNVKKELLAEGIKVSENIKIGMMVEIPAAAVLADQFAKHVDFFSIGTNDLIQYSFAADRMNEKVAYLYQPYNPAILRLVKNVIDASHKEGKWTGMCGEMAGDLKAVPLLLGLGLDEFSMSASSVLKARELIGNLSYNDMQELANKAINVSTTEEVLELIEKI